jgi:hypothetical protein
MQAIFAQITLSGDILRCSFRARSASPQQRELPVMKYILVYGLLSGAVIIAAMLAVLNLSELHSEWIGYLIMIVALTMIFIGVKRYRDVELGGVIKFWRAFGMGLGIAACATLAYVLIWEVYLAMTHYAFMDHYIASLRAHGAPAAEVAQMVAMRDTYNNNALFRMGMTALEIFPVAFAIAVLSAGLLCFPKVLPARR